MAEMGGWWTDSVWLKLAQTSLIFSAEPEHTSRSKAKSRAGHAGAG